MIAQQSNITLDDDDQLLQRWSAVDAASSCSDLGGSSYQYNRNDMGGSGSGNGTSASSVTLTN